MTERRRQLGIDGEAAAAAWYRYAGYEVVATNWTCPTGELDLVVTRPGELVFCEVKTRSSDRFGTGAEAVGARKQAKVRQVAMAYLAEHPGGRRTLRFDVAVVTPGAHGFDVQVIEAAF